MTKALVFDPEARVPFALSLAEQMDLSLFEDASRALREQAEIYDPYTQTSGLPLLSTSSRTYFDTSTGVIFRDDEGKDT